MKDLLKNLRNHLSAMIEEIDNFTLANSEDIIIDRENFKYLKHVKSISSSLKFEIFSYKNDIFFRLDMADSSDVSIYKGIMEKTLDSLVLIKLDKPLYFTKKYEFKYKVESRENTILRKAYGSITKDKQDNE